MYAVMVPTQENTLEVVVLLQLKPGQNKSMWMKLPAVEIAVVGMGYALVEVDTGGNTKFCNTRFHTVVVCLAPPKAYRKET